MNCLIKIQAILKGVLQRKNIRIKRVRAAAIPKDLMENDVDSDSNYTTFIEVNSNAIVYFSRDFKFLLLFSFFFLYLNL